VVEERDCGQRQFVCRKGIIARNGRWKEAVADNAMRPGRNRKCCGTEKNEGVTATAKHRHGKSPEQRQCETIAMASR
jgi:hypothetical protein